MKNLTPELAELIGIMFGDVCLSKYGHYHIINISDHKTDDYEYHNSITKYLPKHMKKLIL
jgi:hypothetical protein